MNTLRFPSAKIAGLGGICYFLLAIYSSSVARKNNAVTKRVLINIQKRLLRCCTLAYSNVFDTCPVPGVLLVKPGFH